MKLSVVADKTEEEEAEVEEESFCFLKGLVAEASKITSSSSSTAGGVPGGVEGPPFKGR